jgi:hypothetical protein
LVETTFNVPVAKAAVRGYDQKNAGCLRFSAQVLPPLAMQTDQKDQ